MNRVRLLRAILRLRASCAASCGDIEQLGVGEVAGNPVVIDGQVRSLYGFAVEAVRHLADRGEVSAKRFFEQHLRNVD